jgi:hypothetical protein
LSAIELAAEHHKVNAVFDRAILHSAVKRQRYLFAHEAKAKIGAVLTDPKFRVLEQVTQDAANMLLLDITLWNEQLLAPEEAARSVELMRIMELAVRLARGHLFGKLDQARPLQTDLDHETDVILRAVLRKLMVSPELFEQRYQHCIEPIWATLSCVTLRSRWPLILSSVLLCSLRSFIAHRAIYHERVASESNGISTSFPALSMEITNRREGGVAFSISAPSIGYFSPEGTTEAEIIRGLCLLTQGESAVEMSWTVEPENRHWRSRLVIVDPTADRNS